MKRLLLVLMLLALASSGVEAKKPQSDTYNVVFIGNSITYGALHKEREKTAPPVFAAQRLEKKLDVDIEMHNCGRSGATTVDFLPERNRDFKRVESAVEKCKASNNAPFVFSIMLGTNDSASVGPTGSPVSNADYKKNLLVMINRLREMCPDAIFVLQRPVWYSPNTYNGAMYLVAGQKRLVGYANILIELAEQHDDIYLGDFKSFDYLKANYKKYFFAENGNAGVFYLHPNVDGAKKLAKRWAQAITRAVKASKK